MHKIFNVSLKLEPNDFVDVLRFSTNMVAENTSDSIQATHLKSCFVKQNNKKRTIFDIMPLLICTFRLGHIVYWSFGERIWYAKGVHKVSKMLLTAWSVDNPG